MFTKKPIALETETTVELIDFDGCGKHMFLCIELNDFFNVGGIRSYSFIDKMNILYKKLSDDASRTPKTIIAIGSNRQNVIHDCGNANRDFMNGNFSGLCVTQLDFLTKHLKKKTENSLTFSKLTVTDIENDASPGKAMEHDSISVKVDENHQQLTTTYNPTIIAQGKKELENNLLRYSWDKDKTTLLLTHIHHHAKQDSKTKINFYDDKDDILNHAINLFKKLPYLIPENIRLDFFRYAPSADEHKNLDLPAAPLEFQEKLEGKGKLLSENVWKAIVKTAATLIAKDDKLEDEEVVRLTKSAKQCLLLQLCNVAAEKIPLSFNKNAGHVTTIYNFVDKNFSALLDVQLAHGHPFLNYFKKHLKSEAFRKNLQWMYPLVFVISIFGLGLASGSALSSMIRSNDFLSVNSPVLPVLFTLGIITSIIGALFLKDNYSKYQNPQLNDEILKAELEDTLNQLLPIGYNTVYRSV